jgi:hypothetical protein
MTAGTTGNPGPGRTARVLLVATMLALAPLTAQMVILRAEQPSK